MSQYVLGSLYYEGTENNIQLRKIQSEPTEEENKIDLILKVYDDLNPKLRHLLCKENIKYNKT